MNIAYLDDYSNNSSYNGTVRNNHMDVWSDMFHYAANLNGNWLVSQEIFYKYLVPTAEDNPRLFAKWVNDMVRISGLKIKYRSTFSKSISFMKRFKFMKNAKRSELKKALVGLFNAGLYEPVYARNALNKIKKLQVS